MHHFRAEEVLSIKCRHYLQSVICLLCNRSYILVMSHDAQDLFSTVGEIMRSHHVQQVGMAWQVAVEMRRLHSGEMDDAGRKNDVWEEGGRSAKAIQLTVYPDKRCDGGGGLKTDLLWSDAGPQEANFGEGTKKQNNGKVVIHASRGAVSLKLYETTATQLTAQRTQLVSNSLPLPLLGAENRTTSDILHRLPGRLGWLELS